MRESPASFFLTFINVGHGDAILVECPSDAGCFTMLIDGGSARSSEYGGCTGRIRAVDFLEQHGIDHLDVMVNSHMEEDHTCGLIPIAEKWPPKQLWQPYCPDLSLQMCPLRFQQDCSPPLQDFICGLNGYRTLCTIVRQAGGQVLQPSGSPELLGKKSWPCSSLTVEVDGPFQDTISEKVSSFFSALSVDTPAFSPPSQDGIPTCINPVLIQNGSPEEAALSELETLVQNSSLILMLRYAGRSILLPGDADCHAYRHMSSSRSADIFKPGLHGRRNGMSIRLAREVSPEYAVICASSDCRYESAHPEVLRILEDADAQLLFTDCPEVPPYVNGLLPHFGAQFQISESGDIIAHYLRVIR